jgi:hypothetical protein
MTKKQAQLAKKLREHKYVSNLTYYHHRIATVMTMCPLFLEHYEELNEVLPEFFTTDLLKKLEMFSNSLYFKESHEDLGSVGDEQVSNVEELRKFFTDSLK